MKERIGEVKDGATDRFTMKARRSVKLRLNLHACSSDMALLRVSCKVHVCTGSSKSGLEMSSGEKEGQHSSESRARMYAEFPY